MEGLGGVASLLGCLLLCGAMALAGCGSDSSGSSVDVVETSDPAEAFAPLVQLDSRERWRPMGPRWFVDRSQLRFADDQGCGHGEIAVGRALEEQWTPVLNWIFVHGLGKGPQHYEREAQDKRCRPRSSYMYYADQLTRPFERAHRAKGLRLTEGFYLKLMDWAREGPDLLDERGDRRVGDRVPAVFESNAQDVDGEPGLRLTYWQLYGMHQPLDRRGDPIERLTHEGDWERVDVLLQEGDGDDEWVPVALRLHTEKGTRDVPWSSVKRADAGTTAAATHPVLSAERGAHTLSPTVRRDECKECPRWRTWALLADATKQRWYGFGGAWGEVRATGDTSGPLGPHDGRWPPTVRTRGY